MSPDIYQYPYMSMVAVLCIVTACCYVMSGEKRKSFLLAGVLSMPGSLLTFIVVPEYWDPVRLFGWEPGIEDFLFSFTTGAIVWFFAVGVHRQLNFRMNWRTGVKRYLKVPVVGAVLLMLIFLLTDAHVMHKILISMLATALLVTRHHRVTLVRALAAAALFGVFYTIFTAAAFQIFPDFRSQWHWHNLWEATVLSVPLEEIVWACAFGFTWTCIMFYVLDVEHDQQEPVKERMSE
jgi:hypothetical protein